MAEYPLTATTISTSACYPATPQALLESLTQYLTIQIDGYNQPYIVDDAVPSALNQNSPWFETGSSATPGEYGTPKVIRLYSSGQWKEFAQFQQGDMILVPLDYPVAAPWGTQGITYVFGSTGVPNYTVAATPAPPENYKYKVYVGYWNSTL